MTVLPVHIAAGALGILSGALALYAAKGAALHRKSGTVFVISMVAFGESSRGTTVSAASDGGVI